MLLDKDFLLKLDSQQNVEKFARVTLLNKDELPIEQIEGKITSGGSINMDGKSTIRRSCSLTMIAENDFHKSYWAVKSKFKLEIGIRNFIDTTYPDIIWFNQGIYVFTSFSVSRTTNNFTVSLQGKDKGCLINGELSGNFTYQVDLGSMSNIDINGDKTITKLEIKDILINLMHEYAGEPFRNIIINDLNIQGFELMEYRYDKDLFPYRQKDNSIYANMFFEDTAPNFQYNDNKVDFTNKNQQGFETLTSTFEEELEPYDFYMEDDRSTKYRIARIQYGQTGGYKVTNLVYPGELIAAVGETISSILDKIVKVLGQFEYFYDTDGRFIFQKKQYYFDSPIGNTETEEDKFFYQDPIAYTFNNFKMINSVNNSVGISNVKNDFSIHGERTGISGVNIPIHLRFSVDEKPSQYTTISVEDEELKEYNERYSTQLSGQNSVTYKTANTYKNEERIVKCDWREVIYRMALDHFKYGFLDSFEVKVIQANSDIFPTGITSYEQYYTDLIGQWKDLYFPEIFEYQKQLENASEAAKPLILSKMQGKNPEDYFSNGWNKKKDTAPEALNFWFDFLEPDGRVDNYGVRQIGSRTKTINDNSIKAIYFRRTPDVIFSEDINEGDQISGYRYLQIPGLDGMFVNSAQGRSAKDELDTLVYNHLFSADNITIQVKPIYYLEPNTKIQLIDEETNLSGEYIISRLSIPLSYNGMMSITATKAVKNIF